MTTLSCEQVDALLGAYALDALTAPEAADVAAHLETCVEHRQAADELRQTVSLLALAVEEREPSPQLRDRVIASIRSVSSEPVHDPEPRPPVVPIRRRPLRPPLAPAVMKVRSISSISGEGAGVPSGSPSVGNLV